MLTSSNAEIGGRSNSGSRITDFRALRAPTTVDDYFEDDIDEGHEDEESDEEEDEESRRQAIREKWRVLCVLKCAEAELQSFARKDRIKERVDEWLVGFMSKLRVRQGSVGVPQPGVGVGGGGSSEGRGGDPPVIRRSPSTQETAVAGNVGDTVVPTVSITVPGGGAGSVPPVADNDGSQKDSGIEIDLAAEERYMD